MSSKISKLKIRLLPFSLNSNIIPLIEDQNITQISNTSTVFQAFKHYIVTLVLAQIRIPIQRPIYLVISSSKYPIISTYLLSYEDIFYPYQTNLVVLIIIPYLKHYILTPT